MKDKNLMALALSITPHTALQSDRLQNFYTRIPVWEFFLHAACVTVVLCSEFLLLCIRDTALGRIPIVPWSFGLLHTATGKMSYHPLHKTLGGVIPSLLYWKMYPLNETIFWNVRRLHDAKKRTAVFTHHNPSSICLQETHLTRPNLIIDSHTISSAVPFHVFNTFQGSEYFDIKDCSL